MTPALLKLRNEGHEVIACAARGTPAHGVFRNAGFAVWPPPDDVDETSLASRLAEELKRRGCHGVLVGVTADGGVDRSALRAGLKVGIPTAAIIETWPNRWLAMNGKRDLPLYTQALRVFVIDEDSSRALRGAGFGDAQVVITGDPYKDTMLSYLAERDGHRRQQRLTFGIPQDAIVIQWSVTDDLDDPTSYSSSYKGWLGMAEAGAIVEYLTALRAAAASGCQTPIRGIVRQKPSYGTNFIQKLLRGEEDIVVFDNDRLHMGVPTILASDVVVGQATTMIENAAILGVPGICYLPALNRPDPMATNALGYTVPLYRPGELGEIIRELGDDPRCALNKLRRRIRPLNIAHGATDRVKDELLRLMAA